MSIEEQKISQIILPNIRDLNPQLVIADDRIDLYKSINEILLDSNTNLCDCYSEINKNNKNNINENLKTTNDCHFLNIEKQIGSDSVAGIVYLSKINNITCALKIMPIISNESVNNNENEIRIAKLVSDLVIQNKSIHFPIVYGSYNCDDIVYPKNCKFLPDSFKYAVDEKIIQIFEQKLNNFNTPITAAKKRMFKIKISKNIIDKNDNFTEKYINEMIEWFNKNYESYGLPNGNEITKDDVLPKLKGNILISELANMDLKQFIEIHLNENKIIQDDVWINIFMQVLNGINDLQNNNIIHEDLHLGNVLLLIKNNNFTCLIHDFGSSKIKDVDNFNWTENDRSFDILKFIDSILNYHFGNNMVSTDTMSEKIKLFTNDLLNYAMNNKSTSANFINDMIEFIKLKNNNSSIGGKKQKKTKKTKKNKKNKKKKNNKKKKKNKNKKNKKKKN